LTVIVRLAQAHIDAMVAHALEEAPMECCGQLGGKDGLVATVYTAANAEASPYRFSIDFKEQRRIQEAMDEAGEELQGFYHSHTGSEPRPSPTDIRMMETFFTPPYAHFVIGTSDPDNPVVRVFYIEDGNYTEHQFEIVE
jgi:[CysO sulfur-carrier protein]-S-L-cysteine hydrolase